MKFQDKFYDIFDHNKCLPSETEDEKCIFRKSYFHRIQPRHIMLYQGSCNTVFLFLIILWTKGIQWRVETGKTGALLSSCHNHKITDNSGMTLQCSGLVRDKRNCVSVLAVLAVVASCAGSKYDEDDEPQHSLGHTSHFCRPV